MHLKIIFFLLTNIVLVASDSRIPSIIKQRARLVELILQDQQELEKYQNLKQDKTDKELQRILVLQDRINKYKQEWDNCGLSIESKLREQKNIRIIESILNKHIRSFSNSAKNHTTAQALAFQIEIWLTNIAISDAELKVKIQDFLNKNKA